MKTALYVPFGSLNREAGIMHLLLRYLGEACSAKQVLQCNGLFSLCDRDGRENWRRGMMSCAQCMNDQHLMAEWSSAELVQLSQYLMPEMVRETERWSKKLTEKNIPRAMFAGNNILDLCRGSFSSRFDTLEPDFSNKMHVNFLKRLILNTSRSLLISREYLKKQRPDVCFIAGASDYISQSFYLEARRQQVRTVRFVWDAGSRNVRILHPETGMAYVCAFSLEDLAQIRGDVDSWPKELIEMLDETLSFLDLSDVQMELPIAQ